MMGGRDPPYRQRRKGWGCTDTELRGFATSATGLFRGPGVFITTASFTNDAREHAARSDPTVILVDGEMLAELMIDHEVGVTAVATYAIKRIDSDFFDEER